MNDVMFILLNDGSGTLAENEQSLRVLCVGQRWITGGKEMMVYWATGLKKSQIKGTDSADRKKRIRAIRKAIETAIFMEQYRTYSVFFEDETDNDVRNYLNFGQYKGND